MKKIILLIFLVVLTIVTLSFKYNIVTSKSENQINNVNAKISEDSSNDTVVIEDYVAGSIFEHKNIKQISTYYDSSLILSEDNYVYSFGANTSGQLGNGETGTDQFIPILISDSADGNFINGQSIVKNVYSIYEFSFIVVEKQDANGNEVGNYVYSFGKNHHGQLGIGVGGGGEDTTNKNIPTLVSNSEDGGFVNGQSIVKKIVGGLYHTLMLIENRDSNKLEIASTLYGFGYNGHGQVGNPSVATNGTPLPTLVEDSVDGNFINGTTIITQLVSGLRFNFFVTEDNLVFGFGENTRFQLGVGDNSNKLAPTLLENSEDGRFTNGTTEIKQITAGQNHMLILTNENYLYGVGGDDLGSLSQTSGTGNNVEKLTLINDSADGIFINGTTVLKEIESGFFSNYIVTENNYVFSFGNNVSGQLGDGTTVVKALPVLLTNANGYINGTTPVLKIFAGAHHVIMQMENLELYSFGLNRNGRLGTGTKPSATQLSTQGVLNLSLSGNAIKHTNDKQDKMKYSGDVLIGSIYPNYNIEIKKVSDPAYTDIKDLVVNDEISIGSGNGFVVNVGEEVEFQVKIESSEIETPVIYNFIIDKKPPIVSDLSSQCSINDGIFYCNVDLSLTVLKDLSGILEIKKIGKVEEIINILDGSVEFVFDNLLFDGEKVEQRIQYIITDESGNQIIFEVTLDNDAPRITIKR